MKNEDIVPGSFPHTTNGLLKDENTEIIKTIFWNLKISPTSAG